VAPKYDYPFIFVRYLNKRWWWRHDLREVAITDQLHTQ